MQGNVGVMGQKLLEGLGVYVVMRFPGFDATESRMHPTSHLAPQLNFHPMNRGLCETWIATFYKVCLHP